MLKVQEAMLKANVGWSKGLSGFEAGKAAAEKAMVGIEESSLVLLYGSVDYDQKQLVNGVKEVVGETPIIGSSSFTGIITPEGFISGEEGFCGVMVLSDEDMMVAVSGVEKETDARLAGQVAAQNALLELEEVMPDYFYMIAPPGEEEAYLKGIQDVVGRIPFFGGSSADNTMEGKMKQYANSKVIENGVVVAFFKTGKKFANTYTGAYRFSGKSGIITKVENKRVLKEIDGKPALEVFAGWLGKPVEELKGMNLLGATIHAPLGVVDVEGDLTWIRHPLVGQEDLSMAIGNDLVEQTTVCLMEATTDELIQSVPDAVVTTRERLEAEAGALLITHCGGRAAGIGKRMNEVVEGIKEVAGDLPFIGVLTFGEYGYEKWSKNGCGGLMLSIFMMEK